MSNDTTQPEMMMAFCIANPGDTVGQVMQIPKPTLTDQPGFALIKVLRAGICNTDLEILQGYMGFTGVLGHEFVGLVEDVNDPAMKEKWTGQRVCGDINVGCGDCRVCLNKDQLDECGCSMMSRNHCPNRTVLGILKRNGTMAEYLTLPVSNLHIVPKDVSDEVAVFAEPLAAACRIPEQGLIRYTLKRTDKVAILGDGKLGLMIAEVLGREYSAFQQQKQEEDNNSDNNKPVLFGKHPQKLDLVKSSSGVECKLVSECQDSSAFNGVAAAHAGKYDVVVDATGSPAGLSLAAGLCRPMGTLVLKSTCAAGKEFNAAPFVIDELRVVGSRCGPIDRALELLNLKDDDADASKSTTNDNNNFHTKPLHVEKYITQTFPLSKAAEAIQCAAEKSTMKVQIICGSES